MPVSVCLRADDEGGHISPERDLAREIDGRLDLTIFPVVETDKTWGMAEAGSRDSDSEGTGTGTFAILIQRPGARNFGRKNRSKEVTHLVYNF